ncbi:MAG: GGDEF domain-containing protein [Campylobacterota bacterium]|nr:GGDEF domain-containing protein [Campylobacterota bacterium]
MSKYVIACIESDIEVLDTLYNKISRIVDSDYIIQSYVNAEQALIGCYNYIITGSEILITITGNNTSALTCEDFILQLYKHSPSTKNILFNDILTVQCMEKLINEASIHKVIPRDFNKIDFELMLLETIGLNAQEKRLKEYQHVIESAVDKRTKELHDINVKLEILATTDSLSGVKNRRSFFESCRPMIHYTRRERKKLAVLMMDIDRFKSVNDLYGHSVGDEVLKLMATTTNTLLRSSDIFARMGGEEFAAVLPGTSQRGAMKAAQNIRQEIENLCYTTTQDQKITFTVSIGVAILQATDAELEVILHRADLALYEAKQTGRNKVVLAPEDLHEELQA